MREEREQGVGTPSKEWLEDVENRRLPRLLWAGPQAVRDAASPANDDENSRVTETSSPWTGTLPREEGEEIKDWRRRRDRSVLYNAFARAVKVMVGKPFSRPINTENVPSETLRKWLDQDVNLERANLTVFAKNVFTNAMIDGVAFILVDYPRAPIEVLTGEVKPSLADARQSGARPYLSLVRADELIGWKWRMNAGKPTLTQARILLRVQVDVGEWEQSTVEKVLVIDEQSFAVYSQGENGKWNEKPDEEPVPHTFGVVPLIPVYCNKVGFMRGRPPLYDLAELNLAHYRSDSDQRHILHVARVPILMGSGFNDEEIDELVVSPNSIVVSANPSASLGYVEHSGSAIAAGRDDLTRLEEQMAMLSLELMLPRPGNPTATQSLLTFTESASELEAMVVSLNDALNAVIELMARLAGEEAGNVQVYNKFLITMRDASDLTALMQMRTKDTPDISRKALIDEMVRRGVMMDTFSLEDDAELLAAEQADALQRAADSMRLQAAGAPPSEEKETE